MTESKALSELDALKKDAERYRMLRRGQHWSVIDGIGDTLRAEGLDAAIDAVMLKTPNAPHEGPARASCAGPLDAVVGPRR